MADFSFPRRSRLRKQVDFERVYQANVYAADQVLVIRALRNAGTSSRIGISLSRQVGNAVVRNRWKRLIREAFRLLRPELPDDLDLVVRPRRGAVPELTAIRTSLKQLVFRLARRLKQEKP